MNYYVYCYLREDGSPYYVGKGKGNRAWKKHQRPISVPKDKGRIYFLKEGLTNKEACKLEISTIAFYGRKDRGGMLLNQTDGGDGGDTVSSKMWITDGTIDKYHPKGEEIPEGWSRGRSKCIFNDPKKQREFALVGDRRGKRSESMKKAWAEGRVVRGGKFER